MTAPETTTYITRTPESPHQYKNKKNVYIHRQIAIPNTLSNSQHPLVKCCFLPSGCGPGCSNSRLAMRGKVNAVVRGRLGEELEAWTTHHDHSIHTLIGTVGGDPE